jgi:hypothetical protein
MVHRLLVTSHTRTLCVRDSLIVALSQILAPGATA